MHPDEFMYRNHNVHINPVFNYQARKQASSSKMLINPAMSVQPPGIPKRPYVNDAFSNFIKRKFNELSQLMYQDSLNQTASTSTQSNLCPWQNQNSLRDANASIDNTVPFQSMFSKGWFFHNSCDTKCIENTPFDIQSCCFINERCTPRNTLDMNDVKRRVLDFYKTKTLSSSSHHLISVSKHKLVRKSDDAKENIPKLSTAKRKCSNALVLCTKRKLIRKSKAAELPALLSRSEKLLKNSKKNYIVKRHSIVRINSAENLSKIVKKKRLNSVRSSDTCPAVVLTKSKLIRKHLSSSKEASSLVTISRHKLRRRIKRDVPERLAQGKLISINPNKLVRSTSLQKSPKEKLISVNANKLVRSSLLQKSSKPEQLISINANKLVRSSLLQRSTKFSTNQTFFAKSVLYHVIRHRRLSHRGSGYVLLTRNKLIKKAKTWKKKNDVPKDRPNKTFVSLGNNKLIRKSLFAKNNKTSEKKPISALSPIKNKLLVRMLNSPSRRIQRFTNHMTRMNLKYVNDDRSIRHKNNKKINRKRRNTICPVFRREGTCAKLLKGDCFCIHDRKYVALCKNFLGGSCDDKDCVLSHEVSPHKLSICRRFLRDCCHFDNCPYLHVKPALEAGICVQFLKGYCESGETCTNWHVYACPDYKSTSRCAKADTCRLPHLSLSYFEGKAENSDEEDGNNWRYFEKNKIDEKENNSISIIPERHSLGELPDYIPI